MKDVSKILLEIETWLYTISGSKSHSPHTAFHKTRSLSVNPNVHIHFQLNTWQRLTKQKAKNACPVTISVKVLLPRYAIRHMQPKIHPFRSLVHHASTFTNLLEFLAGIDDECRNLLYRNPVEFSVTPSMGWLLPCSANHHTLSDPKRFHNWT